MKKLTLIIAILGVFSSGVFAQRLENKAPGTEKDRSHRGENLKSELGLSDEQYAKIKEMRAQHAKERQSLRNSHREALKQQHEGFKKQMGTVLNPEQMAKFEAKMQNRNREYNPRNGYNHKRNNHGMKGKKPATDDDKN